MVFYIKMRINMAIYKYRVEKMKRISKKLQKCMKSGSIAGFYRMRILSERLNSISSKIEIMMPKVFS